MRLINTNSLCLKEFHGDSLPDYVILSHTWGAEEISLQEFEARDTTTTAKLGYRKIVKYVELARQSNYDWAWIDTCSIDKSSSADLSEAINSMFDWYRNAKECITYLDDVDFSANIDLSSFQKSRWFTRGWTVRRPLVLHLSSLTLKQLQELIAPVEVTFFDCHWKPFGSKTGNLTRVGCFQELAGLISSITRIDIKILKRDAYVGLAALLRSCSVAERMSWAADRVTTRQEDRAYSLLGLFDINMPLLYGEGRNAFVRLQEEIIKAIDDQSIFAWGIRQPLWATKTDVGVLARTPDDFRYSADYIPYRPRADSVPAQVTSRGVNMDVLVYHEDSKSYAVLECKHKSERLAMLAIGIDKSGHFYTRRIEMVNVSYHHLIGIDAQTIVLAVRAGRRQVQNEDLSRNYTFALNFESLRCGYLPSLVFPERRPISQQVHMYASNDMTTGAIEVSLISSNPDLATVKIALACRNHAQSLSQDNTHLQVASVICVSGTPDLCSEEKINSQVEFDLIRLVQERLQHKTPDVRLAKVSENVVLSVEHSVSRLFDERIVLIRVETVLLPDMSARYEALKDRICSYKNT